LETSRAGENGWGKHGHHSVTTKDCVSRRKSSVSPGLHEYTNTRAASIGVFAGTVPDVIPVMNTSGAWLYTNDSMMIRVVERPADGNRIEVTADGPAALRGRHLFATHVEATEFRRLLERQLTAAGFAVMPRAVSAPSA
jgi:hypothetical protein